jgi:hypothetical protein
VSSVHEVIQMLILRIIGPKQHGIYLKKAGYLTETSMKPHLIRTRSRRAGEMNSWMKRLPEVVMVLAMTGIANIARERKIRAGIGM